MDFFAFELIKEDAPSTKMAQLQFLKDNNFAVVEHFLVESDDGEEIDKAAFIERIQNKWGKYFPVW